MYRRSAASTASSNFASAFHLRFRGRDENRTRYPSRAPTVPDPCWSADARPPANAAAPPRSRRRPSQPPSPRTEPAPPHPSPSLPLRRHVVACRHRKQTLISTANDLLERPGFTRAPQRPEQRGELARQRRRRPPVRPVQTTRKSHRGRRPNIINSVTLEPREMPPKRRLHGFAGIDHEPWHRRLHTAVNRLTCRSDTENAAASSATVSPLRRLLRSSSTAMSSNFTEDHPFPSDVDRCPAMSECPGPRTGEGYGDCGSHERISSPKKRVRRDGRHGFLRARHLRDSASRRLYSRSSELGGDAVSASRGIRIEPPGVTRIEGNVPLRTPR